MPELLICEFSWQAGILERALTGKEMVVALNPDSAYALERHGVPFSRISDHYSHQELWEEYPELTKRMQQLTARLDEIVWEVDKRFGDERLRIFDFLFYPLKVSLDQLTYFVHVFSRILKDHAISKVTCLERKGPFLDDLVLYRADFSLASFVLELLKDQHKFQLVYIPYPPAHCPANKVSRSPFSFGQPAIRGLLEKLLSCKDKAAAMRDALMNPRTTLLSVGCKELDPLRSPLRERRMRLLNYHDGIAYAGQDGAYPHTREILSRISQDKTIRAVLQYAGVDLYALVLPNITRFLNSFDRLWAGFQRTAKFFDRHRIEVVFLASYAPFYVPNIVVSHLCRARNIPCFCWMHGGYGAYYSLPGYDVADFRLGQLHCVYGQANKALLESDKCVTHVLGFKGQDVYVMGSPLVEGRYHNYVRPSNEKKRILLTIGNHYPHNSFYFGYNRPCAEFYNWDEHRAIIQALVKHQHRYDIIIKDYRDSPMRGTWDALLEDLHGDKIQVITSSKPYKDILISSDLHIFSWVSTTFMESLLTDADMFLLDKSDLTDEAEDRFRETIGFSTDIPEFVAKLDAYLAAGQFYTQDKDRLRRYFMDFENRGKRADILANLVLDRAGSASRPSSLACST